MEMWITREVIHNQDPGNSKAQENIAINNVKSAENQRSGHTREKPIVDNSIVDNSSVVNSANIIKNQPPETDKVVEKPQSEKSYPQRTSFQRGAKMEIEEIAKELSTLINADKQRDYGTFSDVPEQGGQEKIKPLWINEELSTITVDKIYAKAKNNEFLAGSMLKKHIAKCLEVLGENLLFATVAKLDFVCKVETCEVLAMKSVAELLEKNMNLLFGCAAGFQIKIKEIETFTLSTQKEIDKLKNYFGEELLKIM